MNRILSIRSSRMNRIGIEFSIPNVGRRTDKFSFFGTCRGPSNELNIFRRDNIVVNVLKCGTRTKPTWFQRKLSRKQSCG